jgi:hypothetical protein
VRKAAVARTACPRRGLTDLAIQTHVLEGAGIKVERSGLMHLNRACVFPDLENLFTIADLSEAIRPALGAVDRELSRLKAAAPSAAEPSVAIGPQCRAPYDCPFIEACWKNVPAFSTLNIPRLRAAKKAQLIERGLFRFEDLPEDFPLSKLQREFAARFQDGRFEYFEYMHDSPWR